MNINGFFNSLGRHLISDFKGKVEQRFSEKEKKVAAFAIPLFSSLFKSVVNLFRGRALLKGIDKRLGAEGKSEKERYAAIVNKLLGKSDRELAKRFGVKDGKVLREKLDKTAKELEAGSSEGVKRAKSLVGNLRGRVKKEMKGNLFTFFSSIINVAAVVTLIAAPELPIVSALLFGLSGVIAKQRGREEEQEKFFGQAHELRTQLAA